MSRARNPEDYVIGDDVEITDVDLEQEEIYVNGERLTEERVEELAAESVRLAREANLVPGGKSLSGEGKHSPVVQVRVSESTKALLAGIAKSRKMSVSKLSRQVLDDFVDAHSGEAR
uniref:CopG antitoxin n=1 Tax=Mycobacterium phage JustASigh TaxID=3158894 RepID=A0AAU8GQH8_9CAUD